MVASRQLPTAALERVEKLAKDLLSGEGSGNVPAFIEATTQLPLSNFDVSERAIRSAIYRSSRPSLIVPWLAKSKQHRFVVRWLDIMSGNGHWRERALHLINGAAPNVYLMVILFRRLNDWVPQVRSAARETIKRVTQKTEPELLAAALWALLPYRSSWKRMKVTDSVVIDEIARRVDVANALAVRISESSSGPAATILKQTARTPSLDKYLVGFAKRAVQPAVRALAYRILFDEKTKWPIGWGWKWIDKSMGERIRVPVFEHRTITIEYDFTEMLKAAATDKSASVRRVAGAALVSRMDDLSSDQLAIAHTLSKDSYPSIAERANYVLTKRGGQS